MYQPSEIHMSHLLKESLSKLKLNSLMVNNNAVQKHM